MDSHDVIVIGLGGVGAQALWRLASRGARVLGLERFSLGHQRGSSHGGTRVTRHAYFEHADYVPLLRFSTRRFRELEAQTGQSLLEACGVLLLGRSGSQLLRASARAAEKWGVPVESLDKQALRARFPLLASEHVEEGLWEPSGGFVRPESSIHAAVAAATSLGAEVKLGARVVGIEDDPAGVTVHTGDDTFRARRVLISAGPWVGRVLPELASLFRVTRQVQGWLRPDEPEQVMPARFPCWLIDRSAQAPLYGVPVDPLAPEPALAKIALHGSVTRADPDVIQRGVGAMERRQLEDLARQYLAGVSGRVGAARTCMYTETVDGHFVLDFVPERPNVVVVGGLSGHGFKLTPALGEAAAEMLLEGRSTLPVEFLNISRLC